jgi:hypothetical protein
MKRTYLSFDSEVSRLAGANPPKNLTKVTQYSGCICECHLALRRILPNLEGNLLNSSPASILHSCEESRYIEFVVKVGVWGGMIPGPLGKPFEMIFQTKWRNVPEISRLHAIESAIKRIDLSLSKNAPDSLQMHWKLLIEDLKWTSVISSKVLHFIYRRHGYNDICPVPVDNAMCRKWLWPRFQKALGDSKVKSVNGHSFSAYLRYLSAIRGWADAYGWSMSEMECALFGKWREDPDAKIF